VDNKIINKEKQNMFLGMLYLLSCFHNQLVAQSDKGLQTGPFGVGVV